MPVFLWAALTPLASAIECADPVSPDELLDAVQRTEQAWIDLDDQGFRDGVHAVAGVLLPCVAHAVDPAVAARVHLLMALQLQAAGDADGARASARAAREVAPDWSPSEELLSPDDPLRAAWAEDLEAAARRRVAEPKVGSLAFDGTNTRLRSTGRPTIAQVFDGTGLASTTAYLAVGEAMPAYEAIPRRRNTLLGCAAGAGALAGVTYGLAWGANGSMYGLAASTGATATEIDGRRAGANAWSVASFGLLGAAAGCGVGAAVVGQR